MEIYCYIAYTTLGLKVLHINRLSKGLCGTLMGLITVT